MTLKVFKVLKATDFRALHTVPVHTGIIQSLPLVCSRGCSNVGEKLSQTFKSQIMVMSIKGLLFKYFTNIGIRVVGKRSWKKREVEKFGLQLETSGFD